VHGELGEIVYCHCQQCRKAQGTAFGTNAVVQRDQLVLVAGADRLTAYESSAGKRRWFCGGCGSPLYSARDAMPEVVRLRIGTLDTPLNERPTAHIFVGSKAEWFEILDALPRYPRLDPER
jgi:hypothetical protein